MLDCTALTHGFSLSHSALQGWAASGEQSGASGGSQEFSPRRLDMLAATHQTLTTRKSVQVELISVSA